MNSSAPLELTDLRDYLARALNETVLPGTTTIITLPVPRCNLESFLQGAERDFGFVWYPKSGVAFAGIGTCHVFEVHGPDRLLQLRSGLQWLSNRLHYECHPEVRQPPMRVFGGLAFAPGAAVESGWDAFGDGFFTLPRWCYGRDGDNVFLSLAVSGDRLPPNWRQTILSEFGRLYGIINSELTDATFLPGEMAVDPPKRTVHQMPSPEWSVLIDRVLAKIRSGHCTKIVAARSTIVQGTAPFDDIDILSRLAYEYPNCFRFAFRRRETTFLGASPERLFEKHGRILSTQALAGTAYNGGLDDATDVGLAQHLLSSQKDVSEHMIVVDDVMERLTPLCDVLAHASRPEIRRVRNLLHLNTPISGKLLPEVDAVDLLEALHPTPAVGGLPRERAVDFIMENEVVKRGWYTGPVGWIGLDGNAEFVVAIRCGLLTGHKATIFAGAGIVAGSKADAEYFETEVKQLPLLRALGARVND